MGYRRIRTLHLTFEQPHDLAGLEVVMRRPRMRDLLDADSFLATGAQRDESTVRAIETLAEAIESWNLEDDDGEPVEPSLDVLKDLDPDFTLGLVQAWTGQFRAVTPPLERPSPAGEPFPEASLPMEVLSPHPRS